MELGVQCDCYFPFVTFTKALVRYSHYLCDYAHMNISAFTNSHEFPRQERFRDHGRSECDKVGRKMAIHDNQKAHGDFASTSKGRASTLSFTQKEYIVRNYDQNINPDMFVTKMISNKISPSSPEQKSTQKRFKKANRDFMNRNKKYLVGKSVPKRMSLDVMIEILDLLKSPGGMRANLAAPIGKYNDPYYPLLERLCVEVHGCRLCAKKSRQRRADQRHLSSGRHKRTS